MTKFPLRIMLAVALCVAAAPAFAAEKTLYKCRSADGSIAFQEAPCEGQALATIPITEEVPVIKIDDPGCRNMARDLWRILGRVDLTEFGEPARQELAQRQQTFREQCKAELERSQRAIECAVLSGAVALSDDAGDAEQQAKTERMKKQHATECGQSVIDADIDRHLRPAAR
jgi:hypothetical protein